MLLEDHLHSCVACRREYSGVRNTPVIPISRPVARRIGWAAAAAVLVGALAIGGYALSPRIDRAMAPSGARGTVASVSGTLVLVSESTTMPLAAGAEIAEGQEIRTGKGSRAVIRLRDGSRVEMDERSDLELQRALERQDHSPGAGQRDGGSRQAAPRPPGSSHVRFPGVGQGHDFRRELGSEGIACLGGSGRGQSGSRRRCRNSCIAASRRPRIGVWR